MKLLCYVCILVIIFVYPDDIENNYKLNDPNKIYIPKSKRLDKGSNINKLVKNLIQSIGSKIDKMTQKWGHTRKLQRLKRVAGGHSPNIKSKMMGRRCSIALASTALAMQVKTGSTQMARHARFDTDAYDIGIDNRCSGCISHKIEDFVGPMIDSKKSIKGFGGSRTTNVKTGTIKWSWLDDNGKSHDFKIPNSLYVPSGSVRLLSPQHWAMEINGKNRKKIGEAGCQTVGDSATLFWNNKKNKLTVPMCRRTNVATLQSAPGYEKYKLFCQQAEADDDTDYPIIAEPSQVFTDDEEEQQDELNKHDQPKKVTWPEGDSKLNSSENKLQGVVENSQRARIITSESDIHIKRENDAAELLAIHCRCGHIGFSRLQEMARQGIINSKFAKCQLPVCSSCLYAQATKRRWRDKPREADSQAIRKEMRPGECVSVDQLVSPTPGFIAQMTGILTTKRYKYATIYVDQGSKLGFTYLQKSADAEETLEGKRAFELYSRQHGVEIKSYHADNGIFRANLWVNDCRVSDQPLTFAGVGAHHQNGFAERRIRTIQGLARTMMIHANKRWPNSISTNLWPYAIRIATVMINESPNMQDSTRRTPQQIFSNSLVQPNQKHWRTFGCPVYVLDSDLQTNKPFHKWKERARVGIYLGRSPNHARSVALVLDRKTGLVSPQFHVKFDSDFSTVKSDDLPSLWQVKAGFVSARKPIKTKSSLPSSSNITSSRGRIINHDNERETNNTRNHERNDRLRRRNTRKRDLHKMQGHQDQNITNRPEGGEATDVPSNELDETKHIDDIQMEDIDKSPKTIAESTEINEIFCLQTMFPDYDSMTDNERDNPLHAYKAVADPDTMYLHQAMKEPDRKEFLKAMQKEVEDQYNNNNFSVINRSQVPKDKSILPAVWQMKRKRDIKSRKIKKYKARLNIDGSRMRHGVDYSETYAPVTSWRSIRILLTLVAKHRWHSKQLDYVLAFPQAPVEREIYMEIPKGIEVEGSNTKDYVLQIHRNIYGQKQAGRVWNHYLAEKLTKVVGFKQSKIDECLFYKGNVMYALYTDDSILAGPDEEELNKVIEQIRQAGLNITEEGNLEDFLGVNIEEKSDGTIHLTQPHLIDQILKDLRLDGEEVKTKETPCASSRLISHFSESEPFDDSFHYRSIIGKLNYLEKSTRPDISYTTHQCARFTVNPKKEHGEAIRWLARYLKGTRDKGIIIKPEKGRNLEMYVDADFAGNWDPKESNERDTARSRHGYVINYEGCPIMWKSQMQTEIALSSTESEYTGLSYALREAIPIMQTMQEMRRHGFPINKTENKVFCTVFEDNSGAIEMANHHKYRPRTKHLNVKLHHFRDYVTRKEIIIRSINTKDQPADLLTKGLNVELTKQHRKFIMGW